MAVTVDLEWRVSCLISVTCCILSQYFVVTLSGKVNDTCVAGVRDWVRTPTPAVVSGIFGDEHTSLHAVSLRAIRDSPAALPARFAP
jgi:hypothetical protein